MGLGIQSALVGEVRAWAGRTSGSEPISGWLLCDGSAYSILTRSELASLFTVIGNTYGGTTSSNFQVPNFSGRSPWGGAASGTYLHTQATRAGSTTLAVHNLTTAEMPRHSHTATVSNYNELAHSFTSSTETVAHTHFGNVAVTGVLNSGFESPIYMNIGSGGGASGYTTSYSDTHTHTISSTSSSGSHTHTVTAGTVGFSSSHENMPPHAKVLFLIKY